MKLLSTEIYLMAAYRKDYTHIIIKELVDKKYFEGIRAIVNPPDDDIEMYDTYEINKEQLLKIIKMLDIELAFRS